MEPDPSVLRAIEDASARDPGNVALKIHYSQLLRDAGRFKECLEQLGQVLSVVPDSLPALLLASEVASVLEDPRASGWTRLYKSLSGTDSNRGVNAEQTPPSTNREEAVSASDVGASPEVPDWDQFLREVLNDPGTRGRVTLADVGGLEGVKERIQQSFLLPLQNPELRRAYGARLRGGLLLWGPPGCGKTFLARAIAGELGAQFVPVGLHQILDMWMGNSEKQLHGLFEMARRNTPCVLFFDEVDAIGHSRMNLGRSAIRNVVAQLLSELDGVDTSNEGIFVVGATNQPWDVDPALRRPGRFDRTMLVLPPDESARAAIFRYNLETRPIGEINYSELARSTEGLSGADIRLVCEDAVERSLAEAIRTSTVRPVGMDQLRGAISEVRPSTTAWFESARNHVRYANDSGDYDELATYFGRRRPKRGTTLE
jgi:SpoVK/Ycf46/Vps4 family AAA+-type ATPase